MSRKTLNGWTRIWIVISGLWVALVFLTNFQNSGPGESFLSSITRWPLQMLLFIVVPPLVLYVLGWGANWAVRWIVRGFLGCSVPGNPRLSPLISPPLGRRTHLRPQGGSPIDPVRLGRVV